MEDQNRFDLENAIIAWRNDCASRPGISRDNARELEGHLRESLKDFLKQGLGEQEAFKAAARQLGAPQELAKEFARENPWGVWRERLFWMALAGFVFNVWSWCIGVLVSKLYNDFGALLPEPDLSPVTRGLLRFLPVLGVAFLLSCGKLEGLQRCVQWCLLSRRRLLLAGTGSLFIAWVLLTFQGLTSSPPDRWILESQAVALVFFWPMALLGLSVALLAPQPPNEEARRSSADGPGNPTRLALLGVASMCVAWPLLAVASSFLFSTSVRLLRPVEIVGSVFWPVVVLAFGAMVAFPLVRRGSADSAVGGRRVVWRDRIFWMAIGGLVQGLWGLVRDVGVTAWSNAAGTTATAAISPLLGVSLYNLILLLPLLAFVLVLWGGAKRGTNMSLALVLRGSTLTIIVLLAASAWIGLELWQQKLVVPPGSYTWPQLLRGYAVWLDWLLPMGLVMLVLWTAPHHGHPEEQTALE